MNVDKETLEICISIAKGCLDYNGGYTREIEQLRAFHHGMHTVISCLTKLRENGCLNDTQLSTVYKIGNLDKNKEKL